MMIAKGIKGIRTYLKTNSIGWHVVVDDAYTHYYFNSLTSIINVHNARNETLIGCQGNVLTFVSKGQS